MYDTMEFIPAGEIIGEAVFFAERTTLSRAGRSSRIKRRTRPKVHFDYGYCQVKSLINDHFR